MGISRLTIGTVKLAQLIQDWIDTHPVLKDHFIVGERIGIPLIVTNDPTYQASGGKTERYFIQYSCPNRSVLWATVFIGDSAISDWFTNTLIKVEDPNFFEKLEKIMIDDHDTLTCAKTCKEQLGQ